MREREREFNSQCTSSVCLICIITVAQISCVYSGQIKKLILDVPYGCILIFGNLSCHYDLPVI